MPKSNTLDRSLPKATPKVAPKALKHLTTRHLERAFGVTAMTLYLWRQGTATINPLPVVQTDGRRVAYSPKAVERWAKANGMAILVPDLAALLADEELKPRKDGRRARILVKAEVTKRAATKSKRESAKREH